MIPQLLLIAGTGSNAGKTTLACRILRELGHLGLVAVKISSHLHPLTPGLEKLREGEGYALLEETNATTDKDTSRMLAAGATRVWLIRCGEGASGKAFLELMKEIPAGTPVICESPLLRDFVEPGLFVVMDSQEVVHPKTAERLKSHPHLSFRLEELETLKTLPFVFKQGRWSVQGQSNKSLIY
ncbi:MAG: hypothetical protein LWW85_08850 [Marinilabiliales bacterium]|nr:hypothetical protein [Marinilabiliales bacterium]